MSPEQQGNSPLSTFLQSQGVVILDGGLGTELERQGVTLDPKLWSAGTAIDAPHILQAVHMSYLEAGVDIIIAASYQASLGGLCQWRGYDTEAAERVLRRTVELACETRDSFWERHREQQGEGRGTTTRRCRPLVAASVGCYGASLADGSEYRGEYGLTIEQLKAWHAPRLRLLAQAGADLLAIETLPCEVEVRAILALLEEGDLCGVPCWVSVACRNGRQLNSGDSLEACARLVVGCRANILSVGVNCTAPHHVAEALASLATAIRKADPPPHHHDQEEGPPKRPLLLLHAYPNSGEAYVDKQWLEASGTPDADLAAMARGWVRDYGVRLVGGCCRTTPDTIRALRSSLIPE